MIRTSVQVARYDSFEDSERAERRYYATLSPNERLALSFEIIADYLESTGEADEGLARVCRVVERRPS
jgi:hypothetical protein